MCGGNPEKTGGSRSPATAHRLMDVFVLSYAGSPRLVRKPMPRPAASSPKLILYSTPQADCHTILKKSGSILAGRSAGRVPKCPIPALRASNRRLPAGRPTHECSPRACSATATSNRFAVSIPFSADFAYRFGGVETAMEPHSFEKKKSAPRLEWGVPPLCALGVSITFSGFDWLFLTFGMVLFSAMQTDSVRREP